MTEKKSVFAEAEELLETRVKEIAPAGSDTEARWKAVMDLWRSPKLGRPLHYDVLPDGLPGTDGFCIVVLGFELEPDGTMQDELIGRLEVARRSALKYPEAYVVCTGGGTAAENKAVTEAGQMAGWLAAHGIAKERIIVEDRSITTTQNAVFTYDILTSRYPQIKSLAIVSSDYHIATGELLFRAEAILRARIPGTEELKVVSNGAYKGYFRYLSPMFKAGALLELSGDKRTAFDIYSGHYWKK
jgi:uncharacterized SAM-binding protein YcdF (DUF218 family)